jgi:hypothetical protein
MPVEDPKDLERAEMEIRINELKEEAMELSGGKMLTGGTENLPPEEELKFWERVVAFEKGPFTTQIEQLKRRGVQLPEPETMDDRQLKAKLWETIGALAEMHTFLHCTDHLSDRELYTRLVRESLREEVPDLPLEDDAGNWEIDMVGSGSEEDARNWLKYYADEDTRAHWLRDFPDYAMPPHEDPPCDRDKDLPEGGTW